MRLDRKTVRQVSIAAYRAIFEGRIARTTFLIRTVLYLSLIAIVIAPLSTVLAPSSKTLTDIYSLFAAIFMAISAVAVVGTYVKRLHDIGVRGYWAIVTLVGVPYLIVQAGYAYTNFRYSRDHFADVRGITDFVGWFMVAAPFLIAMWRGIPGPNKFGPVPAAVEHFLASKLNVVATCGAAAIVIPASIYAGLFQAGIWVGRPSVAPLMPMIESAITGRPFMKCWNLKGVGAASGEQPRGGIYRDGYTGNVFDFILTQDGQIDIAMAGERAGKSFLQDGFRITAYGLGLLEDKPTRPIIESRKRFMIAAIFDQGGAEAAVNYTTFAFSKNTGVWPDYYVVMTTAISSPENEFLPDFATARSKVMIGDCLAS